MSLPSDLEYIIISFVPQSEYLTVCKSWNREIKSIQKKSANIIGKWYNRKIVISDFSNTRDLVRYFIIHYPEEYFITYPEFTIKKLNINPYLLTLLPKLVNRKRSDVRDWMLNMPISLDDWLHVGW